MRSMVYTSITLQTSSERRSIGSAFATPPPP